MLCAGIVLPRNGLSKPEVGNFVVVERGLGPDEMVVTEGQHKLSPGDLLAPRTVAKKEENTDEINEVR